MPRILNKITPLILTIGIFIQPIVALADSVGSNEMSTGLSSALQGEDINNQIHNALASRNNYPHSGKLTFYGGNPSGGACGFDQPQYYANSDYVDYYVAAGADIFKNGENCGMVIEIANPSRFNPENISCTTNSNAKVRVMVIDQCHECNNAHLDLAPKPFADLVGPDLSGTCGIINADWKFISAGLKSNIQIQSKSGTSPYWYGFRFFGHNLPVTSVELKPHGSPTWIGTTKSNGPSFYILDQGGYPLSAPMSVRFTDVNGKVVTAENVITNFDSEAIFDTGVQLSGRVVGNPLD